MIMHLKRTGWVVGLACVLSGPAAAQGEGPLLEPESAATLRSSESVRKEATTARRPAAVVDGACAPIDTRSNRTRAEVQAEARAAHRAGPMSSGECGQ